MHAISTVMASPWIPVLALIALTSYVRVIHGTWLHPAAFPALVWSLFIGSSLLAAPDYELSGLAVWTILGMVAAACVGAAFASKHKACAAFNPGVWSFRRLLRYVLIFSTLAMASVILFTVIKLSEYDLSFSVPGLLALGHLVSIDRYSGVQEPAVVRALWTWIFPASVLGGVTFELAESRLQKCLSLAAVAPALASGFVETTRASVLIPTCCWLGSFLATKICKAGSKYRLFNRRTLFAAAVLGALLASVFFGLDALRVFTPKNDLAVDADYTGSRFRAYSVGSLTYFSNWLAREEPSTGISFGGETFRSAFELLGLQERQVREELDLSGGGQTNIPTAFCPLIEDFTLPGAILVCLVTGYLAGRIYERSGQGDLIAVPLLGAFYTLVLFSPITSLTAYNGPIFGWILVTFLIRPASANEAEPAL